MLKLSGKRIEKKDPNPINDKLEILYVPNDKNYEIIINKVRYPLLKKDNKLVWNVPNEMRGKRLKFKIEALNQSNDIVYSSNDIVVSTSGLTEQISPLSVVAVPYSPSLFAGYPDPKYRQYAMIDEHPIISITNRTIKMPSNYEIVVLQDNLSQLLSFEMNKYADGVDLSNKICSIKYINANGDGGRSLAVNVEIDDQILIVRWLLDDHVSAKDGIVEFSIEFLGENEFGEVYRWQTLKSFLRVEQGIILDESIFEDRYPSVIENILLELNQLRNLINNLPIVQLQVDKTALNTQIILAANELSTKISFDGSDIAVGILWVSQTDWSTLNSSYQSALVIYNNPNADQYNIDIAASNLAVDISNFILTKKKGINSMVPDLSYTFPDIYTVFTMTSNGSIPLTSFLGYDGTQTLSDDLYYNISSPSNMPVRLYYKYTFDINWHEAIFDNFSTTILGNNKISYWGYNSLTNSIYIVGNNTTGAAIELKIVWNGGVV